MTEQEAPSFAIEKLYVKDLSLEVPNAPAIYLERETPEISLHLQTGAQKVGDDILLLADGSGNFTREIGLEMDANRFGMGTRSQRYSMIVKDGVVTELNVEAGGEFRVSSAEYLLEQL